jgi:REP element-mobilizing transposase RayT
MPDHTHLILNPVNCDIGVVMNSLKSAAAREIIDWLKESNYTSSLRRLALKRPQKRGHTCSVWQKDFSAIDLWSPKFIRQKLNYIHLNPVRAGLCKHPGEWHWSSYRAYLPHEGSSVPIEMDWRGYWGKEEFERIVEPAGGARL